MAGWVVPGTKTPQQLAAEQAEAARKRQTTATTTSTTGAGPTAAQTTRLSGGPTSFQTDPEGRTTYQGTTGDPKILADAERLRLENQYASGILGQQNQYSTEAARLANQYATETLGLQNQYGSEADRRRAALQADAESRRWAMFGLNNPAGASPGIQYGAGGDDAAARAAAFARAKDQSGQISRSALDSLQGLMAATGRAGSPIEAGLSSNILSGTAGDLGELTREQYIQDLMGGANRATEIYRGGITQRGQDLANRQSLMGLITAGGLY